MKNNKELTAMELQEEKCKVEIAIAKKILAFQKVCVVNGFDVKGIIFDKFNTDAEASFDIDILIR